MITFAGEKGDSDEIFTTEEEVPHKINYPTGCYRTKAVGIS
jgi:hypothetical protein